MEFGEAMLELTIPPTTAEREALVERLQVE
jgi:hypothetical protein